jgi:hypothetical protein
MSEPRPVRAFAALILVAAALASAGAAHAQSDDPLAQSEDPLALDDAADDGSRVTWLGDLLLRGEHTTGLPFNLPDEDRVRLRLRAGLRWQASDTLEIGAVVEGSRGSDSARIIRFAHDNERINDLNVDELYARWRIGDASALTIGKTALPLELSPMVWDNVLRPAGLAFEHAVEVREFDRFVLSGGIFAGDHLYDDESRILALQAGWRFRDGAPTRGAVLLSYLVFDDLDELVASGLARSNLRAGTELASDFRLVDAQFVFVTPLAERSLEARLDLVHNTGADRDGDGARGSLVWGDSTIARQWEFGLSYQRVQRDAVMAAFNSEDWWFHTAARGVMPWIGYGIDERWRVQLSYFHERPDNRDVYTDRALLDVRADW